MAISVVKAGDFSGQRVDEAVLESSDGVKINLMNWGVTVRDWQVPVPGGMRSVVLGFDSFEPYPEHSPYFGSLAGRVANRIAHGRFELDGARYQLDINFESSHLHGGSEGIGRQVWQMETDSASNAVRFSLSSPDGAMGYPGEIDFTATYTLTGKKLTLELSGVPDKPTPISLVQHHYFNLGITDSVLDHKVHMPHSVAHTETDDGLLITGVVSPVGGTAYDFTSPRIMRDAGGAPVSYDLNYVLATRRNIDDPIAIVQGEDGVLTLKQWSDRPGLQLYNSVWSDVTVPGHGGRTYGQYSGLCFEDQMFPDAVNQPHFPNVICTPDTPYKHTGAFDISQA